MPPRQSFKNDESFLEKISMGAIGTRRVYQNLEQQGHHPIELERGSLDFKIWKTKIKRTRVPDILCLKCGTRIESRAKTDLEISMSHSTSNPERSWDVNMEDDDFVAFVSCKRNGNRPIDWEADELIQYVSIKEMRVSFKSGAATLGVQKGSEEGSESRVKWATSLATSQGEVTTVSDQKVQYRRFDNNRIVTLQLKGGKRSLVNVGEYVSRNQIILSVVPVSRHVECKASMSETAFIDRLSSSSLGDRYAATKALSYYESSQSRQKLLERIEDTKEDIYIRLEAAGSLARRGDDDGFSFLEKNLWDDYRQHRIEATIILGEIDRKRSIDLLVNTLRNPNQQSEVRAGAAWALGQTKHLSILDALVASFGEVEEEIRVEAARSLAKLSRDFPDEVVQLFPTSASNLRSGIAWALSKTHQFTPNQVASALVDDDTRRWIAYILGSQGRERYINYIENLRQIDSEVYFATSVLWQIMDNWVYKLEEYG